MVQHGNYKDFCRYYYIAENVIKEGRVDEKIDADRVAAAKVVVIANLKAYALTKEVDWNENEDTILEGFDELNFVEDVLAFEAVGKERIDEIAEEAKDSVE